MIEQYMALALQPTMRGCRKRSEVAVNIGHISELIDAAVWLSAIDLPVRLICVPEGCLQGFTDEVFDWDHEKYVAEMALDIPGEETEALGRKAKQHNAYIIAQAKIKHPEFPKKLRPTPPTISSPRNRAMRSILSAESPWSWIIRAEFFPSMGMELGLP